MNRWHKVRLALAGNATFYTILIVWAQFSEWA
jgi:hypothetical protein